MDPEAKFLEKLIELQYGQDVTAELVDLSQHVSWAKDWPKNITSFWNAEAFMWKHKIPSNIRETISKELSNFEGKNLDLGCGAFSYISSVGFDVSTKMMQFNDKLIERVVGNLEGPLPFDDCSFNSVTAIFVLNYVTNIDQLVSEIKRVLKVDGTFMAVLSKTGVQTWQKQKEVHSFLQDSWSSLLNTHFTVESYTKEGMCFFRCKGKNP